MSESEATASVDPLKAMGDAIVEAADKVKEGAADIRRSAEQAFPEASNVASKFAYNACYAISYGIVFPSIFLARSVPKDNALVHGLVDGARAAVDMVEEMKKEKAAEHPAGSHETGEGAGPHGH